MPGPIPISGAPTPCAGLPQLTSPSAVLTDRQMNRLHPDLWRHPEDPDYRPLQRDVLSEADELST
ncbi:hypothetical protein ACFQL8_10545 [Streptomyces goshikiensis]|uniref:hypothetical protein n=1 Tax=Streptomyces goshikiensis TaxID=1942 RepID=UPI00093D9F17|nr:hypothetical protein [Streptomyces goshikiensis]OKI38055.1 hypothetical protein A6A28_31100 [Streptomyces sp. CB03578]GHD82126.1 hypothetical protein GCM10010336_69010 [Streptomyces goshikiensis]